MVLQKYFSQLSHTKRLKVIAAGARYMDRTYPNWFKGVVATALKGQFNLTQPASCVIGAGTGRPWTKSEGWELERVVRRSTSVNAIELTVNHGYESYWLVEAFRRAAKTGVVITPGVL